MRAGIAAGAVYVVIFEVIAHVANLTGEANGGIVDRLKYEWDGDDVYRLNP